MKVSCFVWRTEFFLPPVNANISVRMTITPLLVTWCVQQFNIEENIRDKNTASTTAARWSEIPRLCVCGLHTRVELQFWQLVHPTIISLAEESQRTMGPLSSMKQTVKTLYIQYGVKLWQQ